MNNKYRSNLSKNDACSDEVMHDLEVVERLKKKIELMKEGKLKNNFIVLFGSSKSERDYILNYISNQYKEIIEVKDVLSNINPLDRDKNNLEIEKIILSQNSEPNIYINLFSDFDEFMYYGKECVNSVKKGISNKNSLFLFTCSSSIEFCNYFEDNYEVLNVKGPSNKKEFSFLYKDKFKNSNLKSHELEKLGDITFNNKINFKDKFLINSDFVTSIVRDSIKFDGEGLVYPSLDEVKGVIENKMNDFISKKEM